MAHTMVVVPIGSDQTGSTSGRRSWRFLWLLLLAPLLVVSYLLGVRDGASIDGADYLGIITRLKQPQLRLQHTVIARPPPSPAAVTKPPAPIAAPATDTWHQTAPAMGPSMVVDVVYCVNLPEDTSFPRIDYGAIEALFRQTVRHLTPAANQNTNRTQIVRFHLLTNDDGAIGRMRAVHPALRVHDYRLAKPSARSETFLQRYVPQSVNAIEYERGCMWRWIMTADYFAQLLRQEGREQAQAQAQRGPHLILGIDTDVALFQPVSRLVGQGTLQHWTDKGFESRQIVPGAAMLWSPQGLESFAEFIGKVYASPEEASRNVKEWGQTYPFCRPERSLLLPCDVNATTPEMWHMSDMVRPTSTRLE
jgi:hypothetical protein